MSHIDPGEGPTLYLAHVTCYKFLCFRKPVFRKLVNEFPLIPRYKPACEKHSGQAKNY